MKMLERMVGAAVDLLRRRHMLGDDFDRSDAAKTVVEAALGVQRHAGYTALEAISAVCDHFEATGHAHDALLWLKNWNEGATSTDNPEPWRSGR
jgi:hypothetical protein